MEWELCEPEIIAFDELGDVKLSGSIHSVIGGIRSASLAKLSPNQKKEVLKMKQWLYPDRTDESLMGYYVTWPKHLGQ
jgi:hypothetical protein